MPVLPRSSTVPHDVSNSMSSTTLNLLIALLVLLFAILVLIGILYVIRRVRRSRAIARQSLPNHHNARRLTINVYDEKSSILSSPASPPLSPVPEIRITFPDEQDEKTGRRKSGRVLVVRVGEKGVGLEPLQDEEEQLPAYEKERYQSLDLDRIGGLKEKKDIYS